MKKIWVSMLTVCLVAVMLLSPGVGQAEAVYGTVRSDTRISSGPGDQYGTLENLYLYSGDQVLIRTKYSGSDDTWLQVEFYYRGSPVRGYVRKADVNAELRRVTVEAPICTGKVIRQNVTTAAGPYGQGYLVYRSNIRLNTSAIVYEVDDGYAHIEYWSYDKGEKWRSWIALEDLVTDWYFESTGYYGSSRVETSKYEPSPTNAPSTYYGSTGQGYPVGMMFTVISGSCHVKRGAGTDYPTVEYAYVGERYEVLECKTGSTGKDWYRIKINGAYGWISSGLVSLD